MELYTKNIKFSPEHRDHQAKTQDNDGQRKASSGKDVLVGENRKSSVFVGIIFLHQLALLKIYGKRNF